MTFKYRYRRQIFIGVVATIIILGGIVFLIASLKGIEKEKEEPLVIDDSDVKEKKKETKKPEEVKVDIKGAVVTPGIYSLDTDSRVIDVIEKAGGLTDEADTSVINLSKKLIDEMVIIVYTEKEVKNFERVKEVEAKVQAKCRQKDSNSLKNDACIDSTDSSGESTEKSSTGKVSINKGTLEELMTLTGIGESKAKDIIAYREANGPFKKIEDLTKVSGIGDSTLAKIKENITV